MPTMNGPTEPVPPTSAAHPGTDEEPGRYSVPQAARMLGISERAVRKRITAGTMDAHKEGSAWVVLLSATTGAVPDAEPAVLAAQGAAPEAVLDPLEGGARGGTASVDLAPLVAMIERKDAELREMTNSAFAWQFRALRAEERLAQIEAGPIAAPAPADEQQDELEPETVAELRPEPVPQVPPESGWRRLWRTLTGS